jgi:hypothetical protein
VRVRGSEIKKGNGRIAEEERDSVDMIMLDSEERDSTLWEIAAL